MRQLGALTSPLSVYPASPVLLTKNGPLGAPIHSNAGSSEVTVTFLTYLKFENRPRKLLPKSL